ncbi:Pyridoxal phosphate homeostasis protein [Plasmodiophora brassicae]|uniref:Pyridoxal phosphate homeostasis protein n=1 Tax=Plasmodiophora brassicae TaxID=37360 RepID=A0A0G4IMC1_PLABS|nr:hypothetical protein PBRA_004918 [Plasmodiophora brassicae]SPQ99181.1 unnamed protein product [Plasmodiophora brassicae]
MPPNVYENVRSVLQRISAASAMSPGRQGVSLVAVSKSKPAAAIREAYRAGQRVFGENYINEMRNKQDMLRDLDDLEWHFIGHLQMNKCKKLVRCPRLSCVQSVDSIRVANKLQQACHYWPPLSKAILDVFIQVKTSEENTKSGCTIENLLPLAWNIVRMCPRLRLAGLMTIGEYGDDTCFDRLAACRSEVANSLGMAEDELHLSMGMSDDFETAIRYGATTVRVGTTIFGPRHEIYRPSSDEPDDGATAANDESDENDDHDDDKSNEDDDPKNKADM